MNKPELIKNDLGFFLEKKKTGVNRRKPTGQRSMAAARRDPATAGGGETAAARLGFRGRGVSGATWAFGGRGLRLIKPPAEGLQLGHDPIGQ